MISFFAGSDMLRTIETYGRSFHKGRTAKAIQMDEANRHFSFLLRDHRILCRSRRHKIGNAQAFAGADSTRGRGKTGSL